jgi:hypothetical protein
MNYYWLTPDGESFENPEVAALSAFLKKVHSTFFESTPPATTKILSTQPLSLDVISISIDGPNITQKRIREFQVALSDLVRRRLVSTLVVDWKCAPVEEDFTPLPRKVLAFLQEEAVRRCRSNPGSSIANEWIKFDEIRNCDRSASLGDYNNILYAILKDCVNKQPDPDDPTLDEFQAKQK